MSLPLIIGGNSPNYLAYGTNKRLTLFAYDPTIVCSKKPPWIDWIFIAFQRHFIKVNATSPEVYPFRAFLGTSESDLRSRSPWLPDPPSYSILSSVFPSPAPNPTSDYLDLSEDTSFELSGFGSQCVAFVSAFNANYNGRQAAVDVRFESRADWPRIFRFFLGLTLFFVAPAISNNLTSYYISAMGLSVIGSVLIILLIAMRLLPKRTVLLFQGALLIGGGTLSFLLFYLDYLRSLLWGLVLSNVGWALCYAIGTAWLSGSILYWFSLPEKLLQSFPRTQFLFRLLLQSASVLLVASAPHLPLHLPVITDSINFLALVTTEWFNVPPSVVFVASPIVIRVALAGVVLAVVSCVSSAFSRGRRCRRRPQHPSWKKCQFPVLPQATSSPYGGQNRKPIWHPPGSSFRGYLSTTNYGGYCHPLEEDQDDDDNDYEDGNSEHYWDGSGYVFSPIQSRVNSNSSFSRRRQRFSPKSPKRRAQVGWVVMNDAVITDDEEGEEYEDH